MQFISREVRPFWKAVCTVSLWCNKNFNVEYYVRVWINFFPANLMLSSCSKHFCIFSKPPILYSHNMLISQGMHITDLGCACIHRTQKYEAYHRLQKLPDRSELALWMSFGVTWWLCPKAHFAVVERQLGKWENFTAIRPIGRISKHWFI